MAKPGPSLPRLRKHSLALARYRYSTMDHALTSRATVLYDADCGFCRWSLAKLLARDAERRLRPLSLQDPEADRLLGPMEHGRKMHSWHLVTPDGTLRSGGAALIAVLRLLPGGSFVAAPLAAFAPLTNLAYRLVAENRFRLSPLISAADSARARKVIADRSDRPAVESPDASCSVNARPACGL